jgi:hypothetical protein
MERRCSSDGADNNPLMPFLESTNRRSSSRANFMINRRPLFNEAACR